MKTIPASGPELSAFLASVERRAFKQAMFAVRNHETALDIVQDAMMKLVEKYGAHSSNEWPMLFQRILQNTIRDSFRRSKIRTLWMTLFSSFVDSDDEDSDPLDIISAGSEAPGFSSPQRQLEQSRLLSVIETEIEKLPARQREAFVLRYWEEMGISETASVMGCSEGSVKTHCSRATHTLAAALKAKGITL
ncbi:MAG: RNA polymerase sigma factor [Betaproteobacteria bacterium HGW-Betaproteobacteria-11]|nr:MAG: RNA polymerase sigma factor [Betaproteobacteria bacterium HGW-Betaproteobacteria-11]